MRSTLALVCALSLLAAAGCQATYKLRMDEADPFEKQGRRLEKAGEFAKAAEAYAKSERPNAEALALCVEARRGVFISHLTTKLAIVSAAQARCVQPNNDPNGTWDGAIAHYKRSAEFASRIQMRKLECLAISGQAFCMQPDNNPEGSWAEAAKRYAEVAKISKVYDDDETRSEALRRQAICLLEGDVKGELNEEVRRLLERARKLGDEEASDMLAGDAGAYCTACGNRMEVQNARFCPRCGRDQGKFARDEAERAKSKKKGRRSHGPNDPNPANRQGGAK